MPRTTIDSPPAPSVFGLLAMCQNPLAQSSATIERDRFRFYLPCSPLTSPQPSPLSPPLIPSLGVSSSSSAPLKWREKRREKGVTFDRSCSSCGMYGCVLICIGFRNYREESPRVAAAFKSHTFFFPGKRHGSFRCMLTSLGPISYGDLSRERGWVQQHVYVLERSSLVYEPVCNLLSC